MSQRDALDVPREPMNPGSPTTREQHNDDSQSVSLAGSDTYGRRRGVVWWIRRLFTRSRGPRVECVRVVTLEKGDIVVLKLSKALSEPERRHASRVAHQLFGGHRVVLLHPGASLTFVRRLERTQREAS